MKSSFMLLEIGVTYVLYTVVYYGISVYEIFQLSGLPVCCYNIVVLLQDIILAIVRWISVNGWSNGMKNITSPTDLRVKVGQGMSCCPS